MIYSRVTVPNQQSFTELCNMNPLVLLFFLVLNFGISWWNARSSGAYLTESKLIGGWTRFIVWCGLVMSACGFTWVYLTLLTMIAVGTGYLTPYWGEIMFQLGYLIIILPILGSGLGIWAHSIAVAYRERSFGSVGVAGWNTFAQAHNTWQAAKHAPSAFESVFKAFSGKNSKSKDGAAAILVIVLVILAVAGGAMTTAAIARRADREVALDMA